MNNRVADKVRLVLAGLSALACALLALSCASGRADPPATFSIGTTTSEVNGLILIAEEQGYFRRQGLDVVHQIYPSGVAALEGVFSGEVNLATGSEFAFADQVLAGQDLGILAAINRSTLEYLVARADRGIRTLADLEGKRIGVPLGSRPEFALDRFLLFRGLADAQVVLVDVPVQESVEALVSGDVDAVAAWQPYIDRIQEQMGDGVVLWSVQEDQPSYTLVMGTTGWITAHPDIARRFLQALVQAERYVAAEPAAAQELIRDRVDYSEAYMASIWPDHTLSLVLDQPLVVALEDQARWIIEREYGPGREMPDFVGLIYVDGLKAVKPEAVGIIQ